MNFRVLRTAPLIVALALAACVDSSTGTGDTTGSNGTSSTDPSGSWNALQYTFSKVNSTTTTDLIVTGYQVSLVITVAGKVTRTIVGPLNTVTDTGTIAVSSNSVTWTRGTAAVGTGTFSRNSNQMTMDLSGAGVLWDFDHDGTAELATLHSVLVQIAH